MFSFTRIEWKWTGCEYFALCVAVAIIWMIISQRPRWESSFRCLNIIKKYKLFLFFIKFTGFICHKNVLTQFLRLFKWKHFFLKECETVKRQNHKTQGSEANWLTNYLPTKQKLAHRCSKNKRTGRGFQPWNQNFTAPLFCFVDTGSWMTLPSCHTKCFPACRTNYSPDPWGTWLPVTLQNPTRISLLIICGEDSRRSLADQPGSRLLSDLLTLYRSLHAKQALTFFLFLPTRSHYALPFLLKSVIHKMDQVGIWDIQPCSCFSNMFDVQ